MNRAWLKKHAEIATSVGVLLGVATGLISLSGGSFPFWYTPAQAAEDQRSAAKIQQETVTALGKIITELATFGKRVDRLECQNLMVTLQQATDALVRSPTDPIARTLRSSTAAQMRQLPGCSP